MPGCGRADRRHRVHTVRSRADDAEVGAVVAGRGVEAVHDDREVGVAANLHLVPLPFGAECPCGVEVLLTHQPVDRDADDGLAIDERLPVEFAARHLTGLEHAERRVDRPRRQRNFLRRTDFRVGVEPHLGDDHLDRLNETAVEHLLHRSRQRLVRDLAEAHDMPQHVGSFVTAQVGELFCANESHPTGERREQQRKLLADAAWRQAGAVQRRIALQRRLPDRCGAALAGVEPADGGDDVLAGPQQRGHLVGIGHQRRIDHRIGVLRGYLGTDLMETTATVSTVAIDDEPVLVTRQPVHQVTQVRARASAQVETANRISRCEDPSHALDEVLCAGRPIGGLPQREPLGERIIHARLPRESPPFCRSPHSNAADANARGEPPRPTALEDWRPPRISRAPDPVCGRRRAAPATRHRGRRDRGWLPSKCSRQEARAPKPQQPPCRTSPAASPARRRRTGRTARQVHLRRARPRARHDPPSLVLE